MSGHPKGPVGAGDHEDIGIQVCMVVSFLPQQLGSPKLRRADAQSLALQGGVRQGRCSGGSGQLRELKGQVAGGLDHSIVAEWKRK